MEAINFKRRGLLYHLHSMVFTEDPKDTCTYKVNLSIAFCILLVTIHATLLRSILFLSKSYRDDSRHKGLVSHFIFCLFSIISIHFGIFIIEETPIIPDFIIWSQLYTLELIIYSIISMFIGVLTIIIVLGILTLAIGVLILFSQGLSYIWGKISPFINPSYLNIEGDSKTQLGVLYRSAKEKWCKRINWD